MPQPCCPAAADLIALERSNWKLRRVLSALDGMTEVIPVSATTCAHGHLHHDLNMGYVELLDVATIDEWQWILDVNLLGAVRGTRAFVPMLKEQRSGHIVNTASLAGLVHGPGMSSYNAAKAGVVALSETLGFELAPWGIHVSAVCPAFFRTNLHESLQGKDTAMEETALKLITRATMSADEVAETVLKGIDRHKRVILTDRLGRQAYWTKRLVRPAYNRLATQAGQKLARKSGNA